MEDKVKIELEFPIKSSPAILWNFISTPSGLSQWFADKVNVRGDKHMIFIWEGEERSADVPIYPHKRQIKFRWLDEDDSETSTWEMSVVLDELTQDVILQVIDYADLGDEDGLEDLWESQIEDLKSGIGA
jgi:uncharacterized protein YndB with AHSA1/START domain